MCVCVSTQSQEGPIEREREARYTPDIKPYSPDPKPQDFEVTAASQELLAESDVGITLELWGFGHFREGSEELNLLLPPLSPTWGLMGLSK